MYDITPIKNYILYLKRECGLAITLHIWGIDDLVVPSELISFNIHDNPYCVYVKTCSRAKEHCIMKQSAVIRRCAEGPFEGVCHAGVREWVYPIRNGEKAVGFISVSGYQCDCAESYIKAMAEKYGLSVSALWEHYITLKTDFPSQGSVDTLLRPLCDMLELAYTKLQSHSGKKTDFCEDIVRFLKKEHNRDISSEDICKAFFCSRSQLSRKFNSRMGMSIREYINLLRIEDAKSLLGNSALTVAEVAYSVGFSDSNYFTLVFRKITGLTPTSYRRKHRTAK